MKIFKLTLVLALIYISTSTECSTCECSDYQSTYEDGAYFNSKAYCKKSASEKMGKLWEKITEDTTPNGYFSSLETGKILLKSLKPTFNHYGDQLPNGRKKRIHSEGVIAKATFKTTPENPYTGMLQTGSVNTLIRLSAAALYKPEKSKPEEAWENFVPGMSWKFLRSNDFSRNTVAMFNTEGQYSWNFFAHNFTNSFSIEKKEKTPLAKRFLARRFAMNHKHISSIGISDLARYNEEGGRIHNAKYPYRLILHPNPDVRAMFTDNFTRDYKEVLMEIPANTKIWDVYAQENADCEEIKIGEIITQTQFTTSKFADKDLFFRHQRIYEDDVGKYSKRLNFRDYIKFFGIFRVGRPAPIHSLKKCPLGY